MTVAYPPDQYRFILRRAASPLFKVERRRRLGVVMLNPSTATDTEDDATIRSLTSIAERNGYEAITVTNVSPYRATHPMDLVAAYQRDGIDIFARERNDEAIATMLAEVGRVCCAWGANVNRHPDLESRASEIVRMISTYTEEGPFCMHVTKEGHPRHPLYLPRTTVIFPWRRP